MIAPIFQTCLASGQLQNLLGTKPMRLYPFGEHYDKPVYPYAVWQNISGEPEIYLGDRPDIDRFSLQIDVYADTADAVIAVAMAIRDAIEEHAYITRWGAQTIDGETYKYRYSFDIDWLVLR